MTMTRPAFGGRLLGACALGALAIACSNPEATKARHLEKGDAYMAQSQFKDAVLEYRNAVRIDGRDGSARYKLAQAFDKTGDANAAREYIRAADLLPDRSEVQVRAASLMLAAGQHEQALKYAEAGVKADRKSVEAQIVRAYAFAGLKELDTAIEDLEKASEGAPDDFRPYAGLGAIQAARGNLVEAEAAFKKAVETEPASIPAKLALAHFYWSAKRPGDAEQIVAEILRTEESNVPANRLAAIIYLAAKRPDDAEKPLRRLANSKDARAMLTLGDLYVSTGRQELARPLYEALKAEKPTREIATVRLVAMDFAGGKPADAYAALEAQLRETPKSAPLLALKARLLTRDGRQEEALQAGKEAVSATPESAQAQFVLGGAHAANRHFAEAAAAYKEALRLNPSMTVAQMELSRVLMATGQNDEALQHAQAVQKAAPRNPDVRLNLARALLRKGDIRRAEIEVTSLAKEYPNAPVVHALHGQVLLARSDTAAAVRELDRALAGNPAEIEALGPRIAVDISQKRMQDARGRVERALAKAPQNGAVLLTAARLEHRDGQPAAAEAYLRKAIEVDANHLEAYDMLAQLYIGQRRLDDGKRELAELVRRRPGAIGPRTMIGMIQQAQGQNDEAIKTYNSIVRETPSAPVAANNLAYLYAERGEQLDAALEFAQSAKQRLPDNADVSDTLGWVYYKKGLPELAVRAFEFSVEKNPDHPVYLLHLGLAYAKAGDRERAKASLTKALKLKPDVEGATEARAVLASLQG